MHNSILNIIQQIINDNKNKERELNKNIEILVDGNYFKPFTYLYDNNLYPIKHTCN